MKNKLFRHLIPLFCALALLLSLAACGGGEKPKGTPESKPAEVQTPQDSDPAPEPDPAPASESEPEPEEPAEDVSYHFADGMLTITCNKSGVPIDGNKINTILKEATGLTDGDCYDALTSLIINGNDTTISSDLFAACTNLTSVELEGVSRIEPVAFEECTSLTSVQLSDSLVEIRGYAFSGCTSLSQIIIPASVENIDQCAFIYCKSLTDVYFEGDLKFVQGNDANFDLFYGVFYSGDSPEFNNTITIHAPSGSNVEAMTQACSDWDIVDESVMVNLCFEPLA